MRRRLLAFAQPRQRQHRDVIVLAKVDRGFRRFSGVRTRGKESIQTLEAEDLPIGIAGLEETVGVEREVIAFAKIE